MHKWAQGCIAVSVLLSGCAVFDKTPVTNNEVKPVSLRIPAGMTAPNQPSAYDIPDVLITEQNNINANAARRSPTLILATASSSRLDEEETLARVWFERNDFTGDIRPFISNQLKAFFAGQNVALTATDDSDLRFETDWISRSSSSGFWLWKSDNPVDRVRYAIEIAPRPHGRSLSMTVTLLAHEYFQPGEALTALDVKANEVNLLNRVINQVAIAEALVAREQRAQVAEVTLAAGVDQSGRPALITSQSIDIAWSQLELIFPEINLTVNDFNRSIFTYYVSYTQPTRGFWRAVTFRDAPEGLPLTDGEYQLVLSRLANNQTAITLLDKDGEPLTTERVTALYEPMVKATRTAGAEL